MNHFYRIRLRETATKSFIKWLDKQINVEIPKIQNQLEAGLEDKKKKVTKITGVSDTSKTKLVDVSSTSKPKLVDVSSTSKPKLVDVSSTSKPKLVDVSSTSKPKLVDVSTTLKPKLSFSDT